MEDRRVPLAVRVLRWLVLVLFFASCVVFIAYQAAARENPLFYLLAAAFAAGFALLVGLGWRRSRK